MRIASSLRSLLRNNAGVAVIELALAAPILALMVVGVADLSNAYSRKLALEQAAQRSIEKIMQTTATSTPDETVKNEAVAQAGGGLVASDVTVTYELYCDLVKQSDYNTNCTGTQSEARYLNVVVTDEYNPMFPLHFAPINANGTYTVRAEAGMRIQ